MTSSEFTIGLDGTRVSSKVLRPPGGGSSDIFGFGAKQYGSSSTNGTSDKQVNQSTASNTQNRLFGAQTGIYTPSKTQVKSNIFEEEMPAVTKSTKKQYVRRNPITGEEIIMNPQNNGTENNGKDNDEKGKTNDKQENGVEANKTEVPVKTVQTSIRIRNPPGGKSSGIF